MMLPEPPDFFPEAVKFTVYSAVVSERDVETTFMALPPVRQSTSIIVVCGPSSFWYRIDAMPPSNTLRATITSTRYVPPIRYIGPSVHAVPQRGDGPLLSATKRVIKPVQVARNPSVKSSMFRKNVS